MYDDNSATAAGTYKCKLEFIVETKEKLRINLEEKLYSQISLELSDLVNLSKSKFQNSYVRALSYQVFENNGVIKREIVDQIIKNIPKEERINLRKAGIKIGRYHVFLPKMLKPNADLPTFIMFSFKKNFHTFFKVINTIFFNFFIRYKKGKIIN